MAATGNPPLIKQPLTKNNEGRRNKVLERSFKERRIQLQAENLRTSRFNDNAPILGSSSHTRINEKVTVKVNNNNHNHIKERDKKSKVYNNQTSSFEEGSSQINVNDNSNLLKLNNRRNNQEKLINDTNNNRKESVEEKKKTNNNQSSSVTREYSQRNIKNDVGLNNSKNNKEQFINDINNKRKENVEEKKKTNNNRTSLTTEDSRRNIKNDAELSSSKSNQERFINDTNNNIKESVEKNKIINNNQTSFKARSSQNNVTNLRTSETNIKDNAEIFRSNNRSNNVARIIYDTNDNIKESATKKTIINNNQTSSLIREYSQGNIKNNAGKESSAEHVSGDLTKPVSTQLNINIDSRSSIKLHSLYSTLSKPVSLKNSYANCYLNSALQGISSCYLFVEEINQIKSKNTLFKMLVFRSLINSLSQCSSLAMDISRNEIFQEWNKPGQQDSYELLAYMINQVYKELRSNKEEEGELEKRNLNQWLKVPLPMRILMQYDIKCYCKKTSKSPLQSDLAFHLSMNRSMSRNNLQTLFNNFFNEECIEDYECDDSHCASKRATRQVKLHAPLPKTICIHLQRTYWDGFSMRKIDNKVEFNDNLIIKESFCVNDINSEEDQKFKDEKYTLKSVIVHHGNVSFGHYICYKLFHEDWYYTSDSSVHKVAWREVSGSEAYILFYENTSVT